MIKYRRTIDRLIILKDNVPIYGFKIKGGLYNARNRRDKNVSLGNAKSKGIGFERTQIIYDGENKFK